MLWLFAALSVSIVLGTVLLSNDMRNLKSLALRLGIDLAAFSPAPPAEIKRTSTARLSQAVLPPVMRGDVQADQASDFFWVRQTSGPALCNRLREHGVAVSEWTETAFNSDTFECTYENIERDDTGALVSSFFLVVRGDNAGVATGIRIKLVSPALERGGYLDPQFMTVFEQVLDEPHWPDFTEALKAVRSLRDYNSDVGGIAFNFSQEPTWPGRYNLTILPANSAGGPARMMARRVLPGASAADLQGLSPVVEATRMPFLNGWISRVGDTRPMPPAEEKPAATGEEVRRVPWSTAQASQRMLASNPVEAGYFTRSASDRPPLWQFTK